MTLWKRGNVWWVNFYVNGIRHQTSTGTSNRRNAEKIHDKLKQEANLRRFQIVEVNPDLTFDELAGRFEKTNPTHYNLDRLKHLRPFFGPFAIPQITKAKAQEYREMRKAEKPKLTDSTLNKDVGVLRHILYWAVESQFIPSNPLARVPMARERRVKRPVLGVAEEKQILKIASPHLTLIMIAALDTGMRRGELFNQRWEDVDLARNILAVSRSKTPEGEAREIPLTRRLAKLLKAIAAPSGFVFTWDGQHMIDAKRTWYTTQQHAIDRRYRFHDLRHTFNTRLMEAGVISDIRKALMGHEDRDTHSIYTHVELPAKREAILKLERWIAAESKRTKRR